MVNEEPFTSFASFFALAICLLTASSSLVGLPLPRGLAFCNALESLFRACQMSLRTLSRPSIAQVTTWYPSPQRVAFGRCLFIQASIHLAPSPETVLIDALCSGV